MNIKKGIEKVPGGMMLVPMAFSALITTFFPQVWEMGGFVSHIAHNHNAFIGGFLICMGGGMTFKSAPKAIKIGGVTTIIKFGIGVLLGLIIERFFGSSGFLGLTSLAVISAVTNTNGGLYAALTAEFGTNEEVGAISVISINDGPFLTMVALGTAGLANIPFLALIAVIIPIVFGMILGNLDKDMKKFLMAGGTIMIPMMALALGSKLDLAMIFKAGPAGIMLGLVTVGIGGFLNVWADRVTGGTGVAGAACSSTAGNAVATPSAIATVDPSLTQAAIAATPFVAASTITTAILTPILTTFIYKQNQKRKELKKEKVAAETI